MRTRTRTHILRARFSRRFMRMAGQAQRPVQATHTHAGTLRHATGRCPRAHARAATCPPLPSSPASRHNTASGRVVVARTESRPPHTWASSPLLSHQGSTAPSGRGPRLPGSRGRPQAARHAPQARPLSARAGVGHRLGACPLRGDLSQSPRSQVLAGSRGGRRGAGRGARTTAEEPRLYSTGV